MLRLHLLGSPRLERDGQTLEPDTRKATALLAYLAVTGRFHTRDALAALLWPEMDDSHARAALRRTLSSLKSVVGHLPLYVTRDNLGLNKDEVWCDATEFEAAIAEAAHHRHDVAEQCRDCTARLAAAVALYRDTFLSGFSLRDSAEFDDWQLATAEHLRRLLTTALAGLVRAHNAAGDYARAIEYTRRWLAADPLREEAHRWLMQLHAATGARDAALRQYREAVRILDEELGVGPLPETTALYEAIQEGRIVPAVVPPRPAPAAPTPTAPALIGRESAWDTLLAAYADVGTTGRLLAVTGEAGIGKTRLVESFLAHARATGAIGVAATCYEGEADLAYAPFAAALRALARQPDAAARLAAVPAQWRGEVLRLTPEWAESGSAPPRADSPGPGAQARFFAGVSEVICHLLSSTVPGVLFLDDVHWADAASLDLLAYLARRLGDLPVLLVVAWSEAGSAPRLRRLLTEAQRAGTGRVVPLTRWRPSDVLSLVAADERLRPQAAAITDRLYRETEGLPYFVVEYVNALAGRPDNWTMPPSVRDLLAGRLALAGQAELQLLQTAAVIGGSFDYTSLLEASGRSEEEVVGGLERLLERGLIREATDAPRGDWADPRYDFSHQQLRSLAYDETNLARRRLLHRRVAAALQTQTRGAKDSAASLIAYHYRRGGHDAAAADYYRRAGDYARALYANREALDHYETALALGHPATAALHEAKGDLHTLLGAYSAALRAYESAAAQAEPAALARLEHKLGQLHERRGQWELADSHFCAALDQYRDAGAASELARLYGDRSRVAYRAGDLARARALAEEALALAQSAGDAEAEAQGHNALGILARQEGDFAAAQTHLERSLALAEGASTPSARVAALNNLARLRGATGDIDAALALLEQALALGVPQGDRHHEAALYNHRADLLHRAGREEEAMSSLKAAVTIYAEIGLEAGDWQPEVWKLTEW
ncbi:MAG: AAA family ATPase [Candidatus Promineofilum sp.]|nr:AAA family ATPase [Promineifilum sp.]